MKNLIEHQAEDVFLHHYRQFDAEGIKLTILAMERLLSIHDLAQKHIQQIHDALLFLLAYPANEQGFQLANSCMQLLVQTVTKIVKNKPDVFYNSGITGSHVCAQFGLILNKILLDEKLETHELNGVDGDNSDLMGKLAYTLDDVEQELMPNETNTFNKWKKRYLPNIKDPRTLLDYYVNATLKTTGSIAYQESLFAQFQLFTRFSLDPNLLGLSLGRAPIKSPYFHNNGIQKKSSLEEVFALGKPIKITLNDKAKAHLVKVARGSMASLLRETDTFTYANENETELYNMGEGIQIALYYMIPEQKFSLQSYIGYLLFKNGLPMAYGGCWLFAHQAAFGVNVLPPYRGGESAKVVAQLLRVYHYRFNISQFTVDPYQIGKGNSDGIQSGAFWFYYKLGFRPMQNELAELARTENEKMLTDRSYRSSSKILLKLANSDIYWQTAGNTKAFIPLLPLSDSIGQYVAKSFSGNRQTALEFVRKKAQKSAGIKIGSNSFLNRMLLFLEAAGAFEKLKTTDLQKVCAAYSQKDQQEAEAYLALQKVKDFWIILI
ncbi:MAG: hypothetical protein SGJ00_08070 [bacterium]|nr:hypothetical protein [bacterium]